MKTDLHCGACMESFENTELLNKHVEKCPAAITLLPFIYKIWSGDDAIGHPTSHFIRCLHENAHLIKGYAYCIADNMVNLYRSELHYELCKKLDLDYNKFKPFESSKTIKHPTRKEAEWILWDAFREVFYSFGSSITNKP